MQCDGQTSVRLDRPKPDNRGGLIYNIPVNCGKCLNCKKNRVNQWSFRLMKELDVSQTSYFVTLTYDTINIPITENGFMTLKKTDVQDFFKRLRYYEKERKQQFKYDQGLSIKYYAVGEYGTQRKRPHYHIVLFNVMDVKSIYKAWAECININTEDQDWIPFGSIHIDEVNNNTIDYTLKYISKGGTGHKFKAFDGNKEFSLMSKDLGRQLLENKEIKKYYQDNLDINYVINTKGFKVPMPKYYRNKILSKSQKDKQIGIIKRAVEEDRKKTEEELIKKKQSPELVRILAVKQRSKILSRGENRPID